MEPTLMVVGLNHSSAPLAMRERFWIGESRRYEVLRQLKSAEGVEEIVLFSTCCRTEFLLWAEDATLAANSLVQYLGAQHGLKLSEWEHFYRRLDDAALTHIFRIACGLDCPTLCGNEAAACLIAAREQARTMGAAGPCLNAVLEKALSISERVRKETAIEKHTASLPNAVLDLARPIFPSLEGRKLLLLGTGKKIEDSARLMIEQGLGSVVVIDEPARAADVAKKLGGTTATMANRWQSLLDADIVISASGCPHVILTREEAERIAAERNRMALVIIDIAVPRDVDPEVRRVDGILLYDLDSLERIKKVQVADYAAAATEAEKIVAAEVKTFRWQLQAENNLPTALALRRRLDEICRKELDSFAEERGPFTREQDHLLRAITAQIAHGITSALGREIKQLPDKEEQQRIVAALARLFRLNTPASNGNKLEKGKNEGKDRAIAINY
jgi:glutamyl-tRNA reductase